jgi:hypothetical protein
MLPKKKKKEKKLLLPTGVSKSAAHTAQFKLFQMINFFKVERWYSKVG